MSKQSSRQVGPYELVQVLGSGGQAQVFLAIHLLLGTEVALKILPVSALNEQYEQFLHEARTIASLVHPHIVPVLGFDIENDVAYLVMEYAAAGSLRQRHPFRTRLPLSTVVTYVNQVAEALQYAHDQGVIHLDVKPENMLIGKRDEILLSDFGIARGRQPDSLHNMDNAGTIYYAAPEQIEGHPCEASDQYALAIAVYEWLTGTYPFTGSKRDIARQHLVARPPSLREKVPAIPVAVEDVVMKALSKDPEKRFASISEFASALEQASEQESPTSSGTPTSDVTATNGASSGQGTHQYVVIKLLLALLFLFAGIFGIVSSIVYTPGVEISPVSTYLTQNYHITAVTGSPDPARSQVYARIISSTTSATSTTLPASGKGWTQGTQAKGTLTFYNGLQATQTVAAGTIIKLANGLQIVTDATAIIPPANPPYLGAVSVPGHILQVGANGNIATGTLYESCCSADNSITVKNLTAFSGGQDPQPYTFVQQSDIDAAAAALEKTSRPKALLSLQRQVRPNERLIDAVHCTGKVDSDHAAGAIATTFQVTDELTCSSEVYDEAGARQLSMQLFKKDAAKRLGTQFLLARTTVTDPLQPTVTDPNQGTISIIFSVKGLWVYQFTAIQRQKMVRLVAGKSQEEATAVLLKQPGVSNVVIQIPWWVPWGIRDTMPLDLNHINLSIVRINCKQKTLQCKTSPY